MCCGLVSPFCNRLTSSATFTASPAGGLVVLFDGRMKAIAAARAALNHLGKGSQGGTLRIDSAIPVGFGFGSSTGDVVASILAVADCFGVRLSPKTVARLAVSAETASDLVMFAGEAVLFAQRDAVVIERFAGPLPSLHVLSVNTTPDAPVDTLQSPPARYTSDEIDGFSTLRDQLRSAIRHRDVPLIGKVATASAAISQRHLPKPGFDRICAIADRCGGAGIQAAHSGTVIGLLLIWCTLANVTDMAARLLRDAGFPPLFSFRS